MTGGADLTRTFTAVVPPDAVLDALDGLRRRLEPSLPGLRWTSRGNLHFTLRFFGDLTRGEILDAAGVLDAVVPTARAFSLHLGGLGVFPNWKRPRVLWVGVGDGGETLSALARVLERGFRHAGLGEADKPFVPHLTLGRWRDPVEVAEDRVATEAGTSIPAFTVGEVVLMKSALDPRGSIYTPLHGVPLGR